MIGHNHPSRKRKGAMIESAVKYIESIPDEMIGTLTAEDVAAELDTNLEQLSIICKKVKKITLPGFIRRERLHRAFFNLDDRRITSIPQLSKLLKFASVKKFEKEFEKYYGLPPTRFQELKEKVMALNAKQGYKPLEEVAQQLREIV